MRLSPKLSILTYDGAGNRVARSGSGTTLYWPGVSGAIIDESDSTATVMAKQVYFGGTLVWRESVAGNPGMFLFQDHLGSTRMAVTVAGTVKDNVSYYPFGEHIPYSSTTSDNRYGFTGYEEDSDTDYAVFRNLNTIWGRFNRPDPYDGSYDFTNPQSLNRYSYVGNNALIWVDPSGLEWVYNPHDGGFDWWEESTSTLTGYFNGAGFTYITRGNSGTHSGGHGPVAPSKPKSPERQRCEEKAQTAYNTATNRATQDGNRTWGHDIVGITGAGAAGGCAAGLPAAGIGCGFGAAIGGLGGFAFSVPFGLWDATTNRNLAISRAAEDYQTAIRSCPQ